MANYVAMTVKAVARDKSGGTYGATIEGPNPDAPPPTVEVDLTDLDAIDFDAFRDAMLAGAKMDVNTSGVALTSYAIKV